MKQEKNDLAGRILARLAAQPMQPGSPGKRKPLSTSELASQLGVEARQVYAACRKIKQRQKGRKGDRATPELKTGIQKKGRLFFSTVTGEVLHRDNYQEIKRIDSELKAEILKVADGHGLGLDDELDDDHKAEVRDAVLTYVGELAIEAEALENAARLKQLERFEGELDEVLEHTTLREILAILGVRPFPRKIREWGVLAGDIAG